MTTWHDTTAVDEDVERSLLSFLETRLGRPIESTLDLFESGLVNSMFAMELVVHVEQSFDVAVVGSNLRLDNFRSARAMAGMVRRLRSPDAADDGDR
ncbi:phosphopantetheine-binding protein [Actinophytocola sp.]|jgi:methoxymalonate biosynthesis acyl carrier protein|uniref:phosphopantetheine-binding protein n=1 Tax=Actinophytocola sp. TaxID=1872138 RepID=UPI002ED8B509